jgi:hypothetical protein
MPTSKRSDRHRPSEISPADYRFLFSFSFPGLSGAPAWNMGLLHAVQDGAATYRVAIYGPGLTATGWPMIVGHEDRPNPFGHIPRTSVEHAGGGGGCDVCGVHYVHGAAFRHGPTGELVLIGHICADKMGLHVNRGEWTAHQREMAKLRKTAEYQRLREARDAQRATEAVAWLQAHPGLSDALETDHFISRDLKAKLARYGSLSEKQVALALKIAVEASGAVDANEPPRPPQVVPPAGRRTVDATVLSTKSVETPYGFARKMLVQVADGSYRLFGTIPAGLGPVERGSVVHFTATIEPKEEGFGFFSRPIVSAQAQEVANA